MTTVLANIYNKLLTITSHENLLHTANTQSFTSYKQCQPERDSMRENRYICIYIHNIIGKYVNVICSNFN